MPTWERDVHLLRVDKEAVITSGDLIGSAVLALMELIALLRKLIDDNQPVVDREYLLAYVGGDAQPFGQIVGNLQAASKAGKLCVYEEIKGAVDEALPVE